MMDSPIFTQLFSVVGAPTPQSEKLMEVVRDRSGENDDPGSFRLIFDLRPGHGVKWSQNTNEALGIEELTLMSYLEAMHPEFVNIFTIFSRATYSSIIALPSKVLQETSYTFTLNIPFRHSDGRWYWFKMLTKPIAFDQGSNLVCHFNRHYPLVEYRRMLPERPMITVGGLPYPQATKLIQRLANKYFEAHAQRELSGGSFRILSAYREATFWNEEKWITPDKQAVAEKLGLKVSALDRAIVRLLNDVRAFYPAHAVRSISDLAVQLNKMFGEPE